MMLVCVALGCGGAKGPEHPQSVPVQGVALAPGGEPLSNVRVVLTPKEPTGVPVEAFGDTDAQGKFVMTSYKSGDGVVPGKYTVSVDPFNYKDKSGSPKKNTSTANLVPKQYLTSDSSNYVVEVTPDTTKLDIRLK
jgi:hypothetical protein